MVGYIDVGGGMRDVYGAGILDYCLDNGLDFSYYIGVSAGSANIATFLANQKGRTLRFYRDYAMRKEYMSLSNFIKTGSYVGLDYVYGELSRYGGEDALDYDFIVSRNKPFYVVTTNAASGNAEYLNFVNDKRNEYNSLKASCCIPIACKPYSIGDSFYVDGGVSDPVPFRKAFEDGCDKVIVVLTRPIEYRKAHRVPSRVFDIAMKKYPAVGKLLDSSIDKYNEDIEQLQLLEKQGRALIVAPESCCGVETLSRKRKNIEQLYALGYKDAQRIIDFVKE